MRDFSFYRGKKVFITGHTGFKGSWMLAFLHELGAQVCGYALAAPTHPSMFEAIDGNHLCESHIGDVADYDSLFQVMQQFQPEIVFHLAAQPIVLESYHNPKGTYQTNVMGTVNVMEAVRHIDSVRVCVNVTTDKVYENNDTGKDFVETDALGGFDPYSNSKACSELVTKAYRNSFFHVNQYDTHKKTIVTCRAGNVLGGGDWADNRIIPDCVRAVIQGEKVVIRNPAAIRPWQHVLEPITMYLRVAELGYNDPKYSDHYNIGPDESQCMPVSHVIKLFQKYWPEMDYVVQQTVNAPHEAGILKLNTQKAQRELQFRPTYTIDRTIAVTVDWYRAFVRGENMQAFTLQQIEDFLA